jgi:hypothetical protein
VEKIEFNLFSIQIDDNNFVTVDYPGENEGPRTAHAKQFPRHWTTKQIVENIIFVAQASGVEVKANWPN